MSKIIAIDYGRKHIGLAVADTDIRIASPLPGLELGKMSLMLNSVTKVLNKIPDLELVVVGKPTGLDGKPTRMSKEVEEFALNLSNQLGLPVKVWEETLTSQQASINSSLAGRPKRPSKKKDKRHSLAAQIILSEYLAHAYQN